MQRASRSPSPAPHFPAPPLHPFLFPHPPYHPLWQLSPTTRDLRGPSKQCLLQWKRPSPIPRLAPFQTAWEAAHIHANHHDATSQVRFLTWCIRLQTRGHSPVGTHGPLSPTPAHPPPQHTHTPHPPTHAHRHILTHTTRRTLADLKPASLDASTPQSLEASKTRSLEASTPRSLGAANL